jgi:uncharacterized SAM-binding protein YcdF (DUF218 family)
MPSELVLAHAKVVWNYHHVNHAVAAADCILILGSNDIRVAEYAVTLFLGRLAPLIVFSGGYGNFTMEWPLTEAETFRAIAIERGVPETSILVETESTNTGENIAFTRQLLARNGLDPNTFILVQKPFMERRTFATFAKSWPEKEFIVTSPPIPFKSYPNDTITMDDLIHMMVGDLQRIIVYPAKGFQIYQDVPAEVLEAYHALIDAGYTRHLLAGEPTPTSPRCPRGCNAGKNVNSLVLLPTGGFSCP